MITTTDSYRAEILEKKNDHGSFFIEIFEFTDAGIDPRWRFLAMPHRGYPTPFDPALAGQAGTAAVAIAACESMVQELTCEEIQATPEGVWYRV